MYFLGINGGVMTGNQDGAAVLIKDGAIVAAAEEERFIGIKHASGLLPKNAIKFCLKEVGISIKDVANVSFPGATYTNFEETLKDYFDFNFGYVPPITLVDHHLAHVASTYFTWTNDPALILSMDFSGDRISTMAAIGDGTEIREIYRIEKPNSLGIFYSMFTQYLGFEKDNDEYKVMGLSSYGTPKYDLTDVLRKNGDTYKLNYSHLKDSLLSPNIPAPSKQERLYVGNLSLPHRGHLSNEPITSYHQDVAASAQKLLEDIVLHLVERLVKKTGIRKLCVAGGVALNCVMNQKIRESGLVDSFFAPPHASDAGLSIGCALLQNVSSKTDPKVLEHCYLGPSYADEEIREVIEHCHLNYERPASLEQRIASELANGKIVGWFQGRMEFGPRALGARSILADCRRPEMKDRINKLVKFREPFRPFTPSVLEEEAGEYFENATISPYMTVTYNVKKDKQHIIPAVTHVDGTARIQTVNKRTNNRYHKLIEEFNKITGVPVILNTSLNVRGQPIACSPRTAVSIFCATGMDAMGIGPFLLSKKKLSSS